MFVALGLAALFMLAMKVSNISALNNEDGYLVKVHFENVGGLKVRSAVTVAGCGSAGSSASSSTISCSRRG